MYSGVALYVGEKKDEKCVGNVLFLFIIIIIPHKIVIDNNDNNSELHWQLM